MRINASSHHELLVSLNRSDEEIEKLPKEEQIRIANAGMRLYLDTLKDPDVLNLFVKLHTYSPHDRDNEDRQKLREEFYLRMAKSVEGKNIYEIVEEIEANKYDKTIREEYLELYDILTDKGVIDNYIGAMPLFGSGVKNAE